MADFTKVQKALERRGYTVRTFAAAAEAAAYLDGAIDGKTVGFGGSATLDALGVYDKLAAHNTVIWHWKQEANAARKAAMQTQVYLSSANGLAEHGRLSAAAGPQQCEEFLVVDVQIDVVENRLSVLECHSEIREANELFGHVSSPISKKFVCVGSC